jgi:hypothetical protein
LWLGHSRSPITEFGFGEVGIQATDLCSPGMVIQLGVKPNRIDLITTHFIGRAELLRNKEQTGRAKDLGDAEELRKRSNRVV